MDQLRRSTAPTPRILRDCEPDEEGVGRKQLDRDSRKAIEMDERGLETDWKLVGTVGGQEVGVGPRKQPGKVRVGGFLACLASTVVGTE